MTAFCSCQAEMCFGDHGFHLCTHMASSFGIAPLPDPHPQLPPVETWHCSVRWFPIVRPPQSINPFASSIFFHLLSSFAFHQDGRVRGWRRVVLLPGPPVHRPPLQAPPLVSAPARAEADEVQHCTTPEAVIAAAIARHTSQFWLLGTCGWASGSSRIRLLWRSQKLPFLIFWALFPWKIRRACPCPVRVCAYPVPKTYLNLTER